MKTRKKIKREKKVARYVISQGLLSTTHEQKIRTLLRMSYTHKKSSASHLPTPLKKQIKLTLILLPLTLHTLRTIRSFKHTRLQKALPTFLHPPHLQTPHEHLRRAHTANSTPGTGRVSVVSRRDGVQVGEEVGLE